MHIPIELKGLTKVYGSRAVVNALDLQVNQGEIVGFLGPNGAGKTTSIRMALGLVRPTRGTAFVLGKDVWKDPGAVLPRVGSLIESPVAYPYLSARDNLRVFARALGIEGECIVDEIMRRVGLLERAQDRVGTYSAGMKQRLGIALALLGDPDLLVLDEPASSLDPAGMVEIRSLLRSIAERGGTVFLTSHLLPEVQETCDRIAIIDRGRLLRMGRVHDLTAGELEFMIRVDSVADVVGLLRMQPWGEKARLEGTTIICRSPSGRGRELSEFLATAGYAPDSIQERRRTLEEIYLEVVTSSQDGSSSTKATEGRAAR